MTREANQSEAETREKEARVVELRRAGFTLARIAEEVGYADPSGPFQALARYYKRIESEANEHDRAQELERLDRLQVALWPRAIKGDDRAVSTILRIMEMRAKIMGLFAPTKIQAEVVNYDATGDLDADVDELARHFDELDRAKNEVTLIEQQDQGESVYLEEPPSAEGTTTA